MKKDNHFLKAGAILVLSGVLVKVLSAAYRIPLTRMLGPYSMGRYSTIFNIFMPFYSFATAGIAPCISKFTAQYYANKDTKKLVSLKIKAMMLYMTLSFFLTIIFLAFCAVYSKRLNDKIIFTGAVILSPNILFATAENVYKGYTQGKMNMMPTAISNILESVSKTTFGLCGVFFIKYVMNNTQQDLPVISCLLAVSISGCICASYLFFSVKEKGAVKFKLLKEVCSKTLLKMSVPISVSALLVSLVSFFDTAVCLPIIKNLPPDIVMQSYKGGSFKSAGEISIYLFGIYQGMVLTIFNLVPAVLSSIGVACLPYITKVTVTENKSQLQKSANRLFRITSGISVPMCTYAFVYRKQILLFLFSTTENQTEISSSLLAIIIPFGIAASFISAFNNILYALEKSDCVFRILLFSSIIKCIISVILSTIPQINIKAFAVSTCIFYTIIFVLSMFKVKEFGIKFSFIKILFVPVSASIVSITAVMYIMKTALLSLPLFWTVAFSGIFFCLLYFLITIMTGFFIDI